MPIRKVDQTSVCSAIADRLCNAQRYSRDEQRQGCRSGHYERNLHTKAGDATLKAHKLKHVAFETAIIERYRRREASVEALMEMYMAGVSVRRVEDNTEALWSTRVSADTVSRLHEKMYEHIEAWRNEPINDVFHYVYQDGIVLKRTWAGEVRNVSVLVVIDVDHEGF